MIHKLTIILTIKNRPDFTLRWLGFMNRDLPSIHIIIADSGDGGNFSQPYIASKFPMLSFEYFKVDAVENDNDYFPKLEEALARVRTKYLLLADDDDFFFMEAAATLCKFLDDNGDYIGARGSSLTLHLYKPTTTKKNLCHGEYYYAFYNPTKSIESNSSLERVRYFTENISKLDLYNNWYSIWRSDEFREILSRIFNSGFSDPRFAEVMLHLTAIYRGKIKCIEEDWYIRQEGTSMLSSMIEEDEKFIRNWIVNDEFSAAKNYIYKICEAESTYTRDKLIEYFGIWIRDFIVGKSSPETNYIQRVLKKILLPIYLKITAVKIFRIPINILLLILRSARLIPASWARKRILLPSLEEHILR